PPVRTSHRWGFNGFGQLGDGTTADRLTPVTVIGLTNAVAIAGGPGHTCALLADSTARCWGLNLFGQLGDGTTTDRLTPTHVTTVVLTTLGPLVLNLAPVVQIATGGNHTCALKANGAVFCWG